MSELTEKTTRLCRLLLEHTTAQDTGLREERRLAEEILELAEEDPDRDELTILECRPRRGHRQEQEEWQGTGGETE